MSGDYEVGYRKPPVATRFQKGTGGNRKGRRKGQKNFKTQLLEELAQLVVLNENGKPVRMTKLKAVIKALTHKAMKGDTRAVAQILDLVDRLMGFDEEEAHVVHASDEEIAATFFRNYREAFE